MENIEYYKKYDERYKISHSQGVAWAGEKHSKLLEKYLKDIPKDKSILEIGCGEGQNALYMLKQGYNILACDVSKNAICWCKNKAEQENINKDIFFTLDILKDNLNQKFDIIFCFSVLHMFVTNKHRDKFYKFLSNHINENGTAIITSMGDGKVSFTSSIDTDEKVSNNNITTQKLPCKIASLDEIKEEIERNGLRLKNTYISSEIQGFEKSIVVEIKRN